MTRRRTIRSGGALALLALVVTLAPWLGLRDPSAQPDTGVLRDLPPLSRPRAVRLADGTVRYAHEVREAPEGALEVRRGDSWRRLPREALAPTPVARPLYLLGTDGLGRDLLSRLVHGGRVSLAVGLLGACLALSLGTCVGLSAGLAGGRIDSLLMRATDVVLCVPRLFLALLVVALYGPSLVTTVVVLGVTSWMGAARVVRGEVLSLRERDFVQAARASGASPWRTGLRHLLPAALAPLSVEAVLRVADTILLESALSFLELGVRPPVPSWGNLIADGRHDLLGAWWVATLPGLAIALTVLALHDLGEAVRAPLAQPRCAAPRPAPPPPPAASLAAVAE